jgi:zinc protease
VNAKVSPPLDRSHPPIPGSPRVFTAPEIERRALSHGVQLLSVRDITVPLLQLEWVLPLGAQLDPPQMAGRASLTASLLDEGTQRFSGTEISDRIDRLGGSLGCSADWEATYAGCAAMSWFITDALEILGEIVLHPLFPEREVERVRRLRLAALRQRLDRPQTLAADWLSFLLYRGSPYGTPLVGARDTVASLQRDDLETFHRTALMATPSTFVAVGEFDPDHLARLLQSCLQNATAESHRRHGRLESPLSRTIAVRRSGS